MKQEASILRRKLLCFILLLAEFSASFADDSSFAFNGFKPSDLTLSDFATVTSNGLLQLTNHTSQVTGHAFYSPKLRFNSTRLSFSTTFVFAIVPLMPGISGHGLAFVLSPSKLFPNSISSQHLGLFPDNGNPDDHLVAVELDTVKNTEFKDINDNHVGVDVNSLVSTNSKQVGFTKDGVFTALRLISGDPMQIWIDYNGERTQLNVSIAPLNESKPEHPLLLTKINLSEIILDEMYIGFSSSTGAATGCHYVLGWSFGFDGDTPPLDLANLPKLPRQGSSRSSVLPIALPLSAVILLLLAIAVVYFALQRRKKFAELLEDWEIPYGPQRFSYKDLFRATKGFSDGNLLGAGGFGRVYRGALPKSKLEIAVKKISHESRQGMREFVAEIVSMGRLRHRNLVQLIGYCRRQGELLLVYDYMPNGSLDRFLFDRNRPALNWVQRFHIIKGVAAGLLYLHEGWEQVVIHRDIKAGNVLLDSEFSPKLGDFGLARLYDRDANPHTTHIVGTLGYLAPEMSKTGKATTQTDVYAFGAFLLEVACGKRPMESHAGAETPGLVDHVLECWKTRTILEVSDSRLGENYVAAEVELVLKLGLACLHPEPSARPSMQQVVQFLEGDAALPSLSADGIVSSLSKSRYDASFDEFLAAHTSASDWETNPRNTSSLFSGTPSPVTPCTATVNLVC